MRRTPILRGFGIGPFYSLLGMSPTIIESPKLTENNTSTVHKHMLERDVRIIERTGVWLQAFDSEPFLPAFMVMKHNSHLLPELPRVILYTKMDQLMNYNIVNNRHRRHDYIPVQIEGSILRTDSPSLHLILDNDPAWFVADS